MPNGRNGGWKALTEDCTQGRHGEVRLGGPTAAAGENGGWGGGGGENLGLRESPNNPYPVTGKTLNEEGVPGQREASF